MVLHRERFLGIVSFLYGKAPFFSVASNTCRNDASCVAVGKEGFPPSEIEPFCQNESQPRKKRRRRKLQSFHLGRDFLTVLLAAVKFSSPAFMPSEKRKSGKGTVVKRENCGERRGGKGKKKGQLANRLFFLLLFSEPAYGK